MGQLAKSTRTFEKSEPNFYSNYCRPILRMFSHYTANHLSVGPVGYSVRDCLPITCSG